MNKKIISVMVCRCGHGAPHHDGQIGICVHPHYDRKRDCKCDKFILSKYIADGKFEYVRALPEPQLTERRQS